MQLIFAFLLSITGSLAARVLTALGIGIFSYAAINTLISNVITQINSSYGAMPSFSLAIVNLAGGGQVLAIICSALVVRGSLMAIKSMRPI